MSDTASLRERLAAALLTLGSQGHARWHYRPLPGGTRNRSFLVTVGELRVVVKLRTPVHGPLLDTAAEARVTALAAQAGLAPAVLGHDAAAGTLLTAYWAEARSWTMRAACVSANVERIASLLRRLHALPVDVPAYALAAVAEEYVRAAGTPTPRAARWAIELLERARRFEARHAPTAFCHNDLVASNVLDDGRELRLIDFEYAVRAAPLLDLAGLAAMNRYSQRACAELVAAYFREEPAPFDAAELADAIRLLRLLAWFWAAANARAAAAPGAYERLRRQLGAWLQTESR